jgi:hypothetical protein
LGNTRIWLFRILVIAAAGFMVWTFFMPWWSANIAEIIGKQNVLIHPWGLETHMGTLEIFAEPGQMPGWFPPLMFLYLSLVMVGLLIGAWVQDKHIRIFGREYDMSKFLIGLVGVSYIVCLGVATVFAAIRTGDFYNLPLQGHIKIDLGEPQVSDVDTGLLIYYYLAYGAAFLLVLLALFRNKIAGRS